ncbi:adenylate/guanylate cyclase domain-containing protein [uncultured Roseobacter sp.]|uniref:adenylate/guanylate cyclase domain-containing protein n=1 Tax=uncultured Roseobacter sp. TaxID=114847 RepID=UPI00261A73DF|nr:tetratricopeptide repeat protein [uncultured Roseobacter sp.]
MADTANKPGSRETLKRRLVAIVFADVANFSTMMSVDEVKTTISVTNRLEKFRDVITSYSGEFKGSAGDNAFMVFESAVDAVTFAVEMQKTLEEENSGLPEEEQIHFRFGINLGEILISGNEITGESINIAARIEAFAAPGQVCISGAAYDHVCTKLKYGYEYLGGQDFKNIGRTIDVFQVHENPTTAAMTPGLRRNLENSAEFKERPVANQSIVVLPFGFQGSDQGDQWFAEGLTEDVTTNLSRFQEFFVIARGSANMFADRTKSPAQAARELGVRYAVDGTVRKAGKRIRITLQLLDALQDRTIWGEQYNRDIEDIFDLQDEITQIIVSATAARIEATERDRMRLLPPANLMAYGFVLKGHRHVLKYTQPEVKQARHLYEDAIGSDARYARAYAAKSRTFNLDWRYDWAEQPDLALDDALSFAREAIDLDEADARGFGELGFAHLYRKEHDPAINAYDRALKLNPNDADLMSDMADALAHMGRSEEAVELLQKAMRLNPFYPDQYIWHLGGAYFNLQRYEDAINTIQKMQNPTEGRRILAASYAHLGRTKEARAQADLVREAHPNFSVERWAAVQPDKFEEDVQHFLDGMKRAGL